MDLSLFLNQIFPVTMSLLSDEQRDEIVGKFVESWGEGDLHYFPMLIRQKKWPLRVVEVANFESLWHHLNSEDGSQAKPTRHLSIHPTVQIVPLTVGASFLKREPGVYVMWKFQEYPKCRSLTSAEAALLDRLLDDELVFAEHLDETESQAFHQLAQDGIVVPAPLSLVGDLSR